MIKLPAQCDTDLKDQFSDFDYIGGDLVSQSSIDSDYSVFRCAIPRIPCAIGFWTGRLPVFISYLALRPITYGSMSGFEAFRAWTDPAYRGRRFASELLEKAAALGPIFSDQEGITDKAFKLWRSQRKLTIEYLDADSGALVPLGLIPAQELFTSFPAVGQKWHMVLRATDP